MMAEATSMSIGSSTTLAVSTVVNTTSTLGVLNPGQPRLTQVVRLVATVPCWVQTGNTPSAAVALDGSFFLPAGIVEYIDLDVGDEISAITESGTPGRLNISSMVKI